MAKAKKSKPREQLVRGRVSLMTKTPAKFIDFAMAPDTATAEKQVAEEHQISETLRNKLVAIRRHLRRIFSIAVGTGHPRRAHLALIPIAASPGPAPSRGP
jgi:hypothetical protein